MGHNASVTDHGQPLREEDVHPDPVRQFAAWYREAEAADDVRLAEAVALATASADGAPSVRMVLLKGFDESGFVFYSNYDSRKGRELAANPRAALLFHWDVLGRQVRIEGPVARTSTEETAAYVRERPRGSQLSALASPQSHTIDSRQVLERRVAELATTRAFAHIRGRLLGACAHDGTLDPHLPTEDIPVEEQSRPWIGG